MPISVPDEDKIERLITALEASDGGPLMVKQVAAEMGVSPNTAGKYVDIAEERGVIETDTYGPAKRVWLPNHAPDEK